jgi:DNA replication protein DnaC
VRRLDPAASAAADPLMSAAPAATRDLVSLPDEPATMTQAECYQRLRAHLAFLRLPAAAEALPGVLDRVRQQNLPVVEALERLLAVEVEVTEARRLAARLRFACLPAPWRISDYDFSAQPGVDQALIRDLATLRFLDEAANVVFIGPPGVGKTMLAIGLARAAVQAGHRVYFTTADDLTARCAKAAREGRWGTCMRFYAGPRLLVIDELGYRTRLDEDAASALFQVVSQRYLKSSTIITAHVGVASWADRLGDPMLAAALLDRLLHKGIVCGIDGPSYRMRSHQARAEALRAATKAATP